MRAISEGDQFTALILAPLGRDATIAGLMLTEAGIRSLICHGLADLGQRLNDDTAFVLVTDEVLRHGDLTTVAQFIESQPAWSSLPFVVLTRQGGGAERNPEAARQSGLLRNTTFVERPFHATTFVSVAQSAMRGRLRQFEARTALTTIRRNEEMLRTALRAGRLGAWELDTATHRLDTSPTAKAVFGRAADEPFDYAHLIEAIHPDDRAAFLKSLNAQDGEAVARPVENRVTWPDGSLHWVESHAVLAPGDGARARLAGVFADVTARKTAEATLTALNETLERRVAERTADLERAHAAILSQTAQREQAERDLLQAQKTETIGQLTGGVAHDFNNLLAAVMSNLDLLARHTAGDDRAARLIDGAMQGAQRGAALTQRMLAFARRQDLIVEPHSLTHLVQRAEELLRRSIGDGIELRLDLSRRVPMALVDGNQFDLALLNLVINARDAMPDGGVITVGVDAPSDGSPDRPDGYVRLTVTDDGQGMDEATLEKATQPFFSTKEPGKGTGLGLSMIHGLALQLNGRLHLESRVGGGTTAELWIPATDAMPEPVAAPAAAPPPPGDRPLRILLVDDDVLVSMSSVGMLEDLGHVVMPAYSGAEALELLRTEPAFDLLITDFSMPRMNGGQLAAAARAMQPDLPILLATGYAELPSDGDLKLPHLSKPYLQRQLQTEIGKLVEPRQA